jgi:ATP-binding cassette, subfamily C, bacterial PrsD
MSRQMNRPKPAKEALWSLSRPLLGIGLFSGFISLLMLTGSFYMLQVYDRVLTSRSIPTLIGITLIALAAFVIQGILDAVRARMLARVAADFEHQLQPKVFDGIRLLPLRGARPDQAMQGVRDLDHMKAFLGGLGPTAFFDMPFMLIFFLACFFLHPLVGVMAILGALIIFALTWMTERRTKQGVAQMTAAAGQRQNLADMVRRNAEAIQAMGMGETFRARWATSGHDLATRNLAVTDASNGIGAAAKIFRMAFQSAVLGVGAWLVIQQQMSPGAMIAASILTSRALAPIETAVAHWRSFVAARQGFYRLDEWLSLAPEQALKTALPAPKTQLVVEDVAVGAPGRQMPVLAGANFALKAGESLLLTGASGSGKSTFVRALAGVWPVMRGSIRLDGATLDQWQSEQLGQHLGYLPQDVELFEGTISQNIARFIEDARDEEIVAAAQAAGAHDLILKLPEGYATRLGENGATLSAGQRQRVGLARAFFRDPFFILLDEPNSNLDLEGEQALVEAIQRVMLRGAVVVVVSHKPALLPVASFVGRVADGKLQVITREEYRQNMMRNAQAQAQSQAQAAQNVAQNAAQRAQPTPQARPGPFGPGAVMAAAGGQVMSPGIPLRQIATSHQPAPGTAKDITLPQTDVTEPKVQAEIDLKKGNAS